MPRTFTYVAAEEDGYAYRAERVSLATAGHEGARRSSAYQSRLTIGFGDREG